MAFVLSTRNDVISRKEASFLNSHKNAERSCRLLFNVITLSIRRECPRLDIGEEALQGLGSYIGQVSILANKLGNPSIVETQHIVIDKHLSIAVWSCNANCWNRHFLRHDLCQYIRHPFQNDRKDACSNQCMAISH